MERVDIFLDAISAEDIGRVSKLLNCEEDVNEGREHKSEYTTALIHAVSTGNIDIVSLLLKGGAHVDTRIPHGTGMGMTALVRAVSGGYIDIVSLLLDRGASVNEIISPYYCHADSSQGTTALLEAVSKGNIDILSLLLNHGALVHKVIELTLKKQTTAFFEAVSKGNRDIVSLLLSHGADVDMMITLDSGKRTTALFEALSKGNIDIISLLLDRGANFNKVITLDSGKRTTALFEALSKGNVDIISLLLDRGVDVNKVGGKYGTALAAVAYGGGMDAVSLLLVRGADVNMVGGTYGTPLIAAVFGGKLDMVSQLLDHGADVNMVGGIHGTAMAVAAYRGQMEIIALLLERGADVNNVGGKYGTALATAAYGRKMNTLQELLDRGVDINKVGGKYGTALAAVAYGGRVDAVSLLLVRGADVNMVGGTYGTPLIAAVFGGKLDIVSQLLDHGADVNMVGGIHGTAMAVAAYRGQMEIIALLLKRGADVNNVGGKYGTALATAASSGRTKVVLRLLEHGADIPVGEITPADDGISWPPFPMPYTYTGPNPYDATSSPSSLILSTKFSAGINLTPEQAGVPCLKLTEKVLWNSLAALVGLPEKNIAQVQHDWIRQDLCYFFIHHFDFGLAYAAVRVAWRHLNNHYMAVVTQRSQWHKKAQALDEARLKAIEDSNDSSSLRIIESPYSIMPRRLWDLKSNRVVDFRMLHATIQTRPAFWAVTHSWTDDMSPVWTAINQYQWPVPLPKGIGLEYLRSELLNLGAEYVWLDVVCLRQKSQVSDIYDAATVDSLEQLRQQEWKIDVPTIGNIYRAAERIVRYFNGLGVHFSNNGWDNSRHWLRRAWTLQEITAETTTINAGIPRDLGRHVFLNSQGEISEKIISPDEILVPRKIIKFRSVLRPVIQLAAQVDSDYGCEIYDLAREMAKRHAGNDRDKLYGLFYLLRTTKLPCYDEHKASGDVWRLSFYLLPPVRKAEILFDFPYRGSDGQWFPTWAQVLDWPTRDPEYDHIRSQISRNSVKDILGEISLFIRNIITIPDVTLEEPKYPGEYGVKIGGKIFGFYLPYLSQEPIDIQDPIFTLATFGIGHTHNWVLCRAVKKQVGKDVGLREVAEVNVLRKVSVMRTDACSELLVGGQNGASLLWNMDCLFV